MERACTGTERFALAIGLDILGKSRYNIPLNDNADWRNVPANAWAYRLGGHQVPNKWLSYREIHVLARAVSPEEVHHFDETTRRVIAILPPRTYPCRTYFRCFWSNAETQ